MFDEVGAFVTNKNKAYAPNKSVQCKSLNDYTKKTQCSEKFICCKKLSGCQKNKAIRIIVCLEENYVRTVPGMSIITLHVAQSSQSLVMVFGKNCKIATKLNVFAKETSVSSKITNQIFFHF